MRLRFFSIFLFLLPLCLFAQDRPDKVILDYSTEDMPLIDVLKELSAQSKVKIAFNDSSIPDKSIKKISVRGRQLGQIIGWVITGTDLTYTVRGDQIVVYLDEYSKLDDEFTISGYVINEASGEKLLYANVYLDDLSIGTQTNDYGFYSLKLKPSKYLIKASYIGFENTLIPLKLKKDTIINFNVKPNIELNEIVIVDKRQEKQKDIEDATVLPLEFVQALSTLGGETDVLRYAMRQSGVTSGADGLGGMSVRGGDVSQNLVMLDGVPVYNTGHALGVISVFNSSTISSAKLIKNGFPARYGGRLSSVMDIRTREGSNKRFQGDVGISAILARASIEGPIVEGKSSFLLAARRTWVDPFLETASRNTFDVQGKDGFLNYSFYDVNAKLNFELNNKNKIYFSFFDGEDGYRNMSKQSNFQDDFVYEELNDNTWDWGKTIASFRWSSNLSKNMFAKFTAYYSKFDFELFKQKRFDTFEQGGEGDTSKIVIASIFASEIQDLGLKADFEKYFNPGYTMRFGIHCVRHQFSPDQLGVNQNSEVVQMNEILESDDLSRLLGGNSINGNELSAYLENEVKIGSTQFNLGGHLSYISTEGKGFFSLQPRFSSVTRLSNKLRFVSSFGIMNQYLHLLSNSGLGLPNDVWIPSTAELAPQSSWQISGGLEADISTSSILKLSGYYKRLSNIITYGENGIFSILDTDQWEQNIPVGDGKSLGIELEFAKTIGKLTTNINYTLSQSSRQFDEIRGGNPFPYRFDRTHSFNLSSVFRITDRAEFTFNWVYGTGTPFTDATNFSIRVINGSEVLIPEFEARNSSRFPDYHRLDFSFNLYTKYKWGRQKISLGAYNAYNRNNPFFIDFARDRNNPSNLEKKNVSIFFFTPALSYSLSFQGK